MRIIHVVESFGGGVFDFLLALTKGMPGYKHVIICGLRPETADDFRSLFPVNVTFHPWKHATREIRPWKDLPAFLELIKFLKKQRNAPVIHLHSSKAGFLGRLAARLLGVENRVLYTTHSIAFLRTDVGNIKKRFFVFLEKTGAGFGGKVIACSRSELEVIQGYGIKGEFIYNGVPDCYESISNGMGKGRDRIIAGTVGRMTEQKNPELFNRIAERFAGGKGLKFLWVGDGELRHSLVSPNIEVTGWVDSEKVDEYIMDMDIYISTSSWEGLPLAAVRAMSLKKPLVLSECPGNIDLVKEGLNGCLFSNLEEAIKCLQRLAEDGEMRERMGEASRALYKEFFTVERMVERYGELYVRIEKSGFR